jgi:hypothetical protein|tara:strand:+ start:378 stop:1460 length:1083 start_codon:yes stop_codon:yes gene_type:complete
MANTTPTTPNTTDSGHPGNSMTHTGVDAHEGSTVTSNAGEHTHLHFDDGYKLHFAEIASLFEDIQADIRIITDRADTLTKGLYKRDADTIAPNAGNIAAQAAFEANLNAAGVLDQLNAELARPTNFADTTSENYATVQGGGTSGSMVGNDQYQRPAAYAGASTVIVDNGDGTTTAQRTNDVTLAQLEAAGLATTGSASGNVKYGNQGKIRNRPIQQALMDIIISAANATSVDALITSGGQLAARDGGVDGRTRTGSNRHDNGYGADLVLYKDGFQGRELSSRNADDLAIMVAFMKAAKAAGATAIGQGNNYMGDTGIHVDIALVGQSSGNLTKISSSTFWGGKSAKRALAPAYLKDIMVA